MQSTKASHKNSLNFSLQLPPIEEQQLRNVAQLLAETVRQLEVMECETRLQLPRERGYYTYQSKTLKAAKSELLTVLATIGVNQISA
jgi:hypothetical protein